jgi:hypothetical protein
MIEGLWAVQYVGLEGHGGGVAVFANGKVLGGDTGYTYVGTFTVQDRTLMARVRVSNFLPGVPNVLGIQGDFDLEISAPVTDNLIQGTAVLVGRPGAGLAVRLMRKASL